MHKQESTCLQFNTVHNGVERKGKTVNELIATCTILHASVEDIYVQLTFAHYTIIDAHCVVQAHANNKYLRIAAIEYFYWRTVHLFEVKQEKNVCGERVQ